MLIRTRPVALLAVFVTLLMLGLTFTYWHSGQKELEDKRQQAFVDSADQITTNIHQRLSSFELMLRGVKGFYESSGYVNQVEYRGYVKALQLKQTLPGLQVVAIALSVQNANKLRHVADMRSRGVLDFQIKPNGERDEYAPISLIEPYSGSNLNAMGFDIASKPVIKQALEQSRDSGDMVLTDKLTLIQDADKAVPAVVMYVPIYAMTQRVDTLDARRKAIVGWVSGPFRIHDLMAGLAKELDADIGIDIYDGDAIFPAKHLYGSGRSFDTSTLKISLGTTRQLEIGNKRWTLAMRTLPAFEDRFSEKRQLPIALGGIALSFLLGGLVWLLGSGRERAVALAREMTQELRDAQTDLEGTLNAMPDVLFELGLDGRYYKYRTSCESLLVAPPEVLLGKLISEVLPAEATATCLAALQEANESGFSSGKQIEVPFGQELKWFELSVARKGGALSSEPRFIMISRDITERKQAESQLRLSAQVFNSSRDGIMVTDAYNKILSVNQAFTDITGYSKEDAVGYDLSVRRSGREGGSFYEEMWQAIVAKGHWQGEVWNCRKNGELYPEWLSISAVKDASGHVTQHIGILSDMTESKAAQERIDYLAHFDTLTQLPNRELLQDRTELALATAKRTTTNVTMMFIDIDRFQNVNDSLGHPIGDKILQTIAARFISHLQADDTVCRPGGDEFILLLPNTDASGAAHVASRMLAMIEEPVVLDNGQQLSLTASIGIAVYPDNGSDFERLSQCADAALLQAKQEGRNNFQFFNEQMHGRAQEVLQIENQLRRALITGELLLYYQPQVDARTSKIVGAEALIRWQHPEWGMVSPGRFIPIAERSGQIVEIGHWVLRTAAQQVMSWRVAGLDVVPVAVNLSALQFHQTTLCDTVSEVLRSSGLPPALLELELTESVAMEDSSFTVDQISKLHAMGITLSIDDFGTGYSSLSYLKRYQIDKLKIDQSFVRDLDRDTDDGAIVRTIINLAHGLGFKTIAEGVETQGQLDYLRANGCDEIQGYFFSRPIPAEAFAVLLQNGGLILDAESAMLAD
ncbi:MAG: EAL domain-containing protein [Pseudomonadota bacterium]